MLDALKLIAAGIILVLGIVLGWVGGSIYADWVSIPAAYEDGETAGRQAEAVHQKRKLDEANAKAEAERIDKQNKIDGIERAYLKRLGAQAEEMAALEAQLQQETQTDANQLPTPSPGGAGACRPALSRGVSEHLDRIGRAAARADPAKPDRALPDRR